MREIKFRGRRLDNEKWLYGSLVITHFKDDEKERYFITQFLGNYTFDHEVDPATVGQYTGLKDKDGREIYEGDVFHYTNEEGYECISQVKYDDEDGCFSITGSQYIYGVNYAIKHLNANLIGNIHDNPKLLKTE